MEKQKALEILKGLKDESFTVTSAWVKEHDFDVYASLFDRLSEFADDPVNLASEDDLKAFERGEWLVNYVFADGEIRYTAGKDWQAIANDTTWAYDTFENVAEYAPEKAELYMKEAE